ncbi:MAG: oxidoreductase [Candidatus Neomarinimicrobiota bacterium]
MNRKALIVGATGLVGGHCLHYLLQSPNYDRVTALVRRPLALENPKLLTVTIDFDQLEQWSGYFAVNDIYCCLGTTIKQAGTRPEFRKVDYDYPVECGRLALRAGAQRYLLVSAMGANAGSRIFYNRVKGEVEQTVINLGFQSTLIFRPSLLLGDRTGFRLGEKLAGWVLRGTAPLLTGPLKKYRPIPAETVTRAMVGQSTEFTTGVRLIESGEIAECADRINCE